MIESQRPIVLSARDVHVTYRVREDERSPVAQRVRRGFRPPPIREVHAVRGVTLDVREGESIGIIGRNGSGKSTLLSAITGLLPASSGEICARSRPTLLGVGAALRPNLSGRANIEIGCMAKGIKRSEIAGLFGDIVEFAGIRDFIDMPLTAYSSGMKARLHFAVATVDRPDILLIDEALAVGDEEFKEKSAERLEEIRAAAGCVVLVTHALGEVKESCDRAIWIDNGNVRAEGDASDVVAQYWEVVRHSRYREREAAG